MDEEKVGGAPIDQPAVPVPDTQPDLRFFLPPGPPLPPKRWQRKWRIGIRTGSILVALLCAVVAIGTVVVGLISATTFTATGSVQVDCSTRSRLLASDVGVGAPVTIVDASTDEVYGSTRLGDFKALKSGICLVSFSVDDIPIADLYTVRIGRSFEELATPTSLRNGVLIR